MNREEILGRLRAVKAPDFEMMVERLDGMEDIADCERGELEWSDLKAMAEEIADEQRRLLRRNAERFALSPKEVSEEEPVGANRTAIRIDPGSYEEDAARAVAFYLARQAATRWEVRKFREKALGGRLLAPEEAEEFLRQEYRERLQEAGHPPEEVDMYVESLRGDRPPLYVPGSLSRLVLYLTAGDMSLGVVASQLEYLYPWKLQDAAWFVLTGEPPEVLPLEVGGNVNHGTYTITVQPWISEEAWRRIYREVQGLQGKAKNRPLEARTLAVFRFFIEQTDAKGHRPSLEELCRRWNELHPEWAFNTPSGLRRAYLRAMETLTPYMTRR